MVHVGVECHGAGCRFAGSMGDPRVRSRFLFHSLSGGFGLAHAGMPSNRVRFTPRPSAGASEAVDQRVINEVVGHQSEEQRRRYRYFYPAVMQEAVRRVFG